MQGLMLFYATHPFWVWLAVAAIFLAIEVATGTGWLLWPAAAGFLVGLLTLVVAPGLPIELGLFAVLTIATTYAARRFLRPVLDASNPDLNDPALRLVGRDGEVLDGFEQRQGPGVRRRQGMGRRRPRGRTGRRTEGAGGVRRGRGADGSVGRPGSTGRLGSFR
jgi:membrane protein implicated in regulation of membrane protease activity